MALGMSAIRRRAMAYSAQKCPAQRQVQHSNAFLGLPWIINAMTQINASRRQTIELPLGGVEALSSGWSLKVLPFPSLLPVLAISPAPMAAFWVLFKQARRDQAVSDSPSLHAWVLAFNILSGLGFILLAVVFFTALLSSRVKRVSTWYCYMMAWMAFCITPFPVIGHQTHADPPPSFAPCVVNSALMYASRPLQVHFVRDSGPSFETIFSAAFGTLSLILQLYLNVSARLRHREVRQGSVFVLLRALSLKNWRAFRALQIHDEHTVSLSIIIRVSVFAFLPLIGLDSVSRLMSRISCKRSLRRIICFWPHVTPTSAYHCRCSIRISNRYRPRLDVLEGRRKDDDAAHSDHNEQ
ncbi:hypothetical protein B0H13DRAFT_1879152 [Mycena leptocephala]|nr:hypothetical protein B0H13DRAFT_1879152 [Mycena leptocephala]